MGMRFSGGILITAFNEAETKMTTVEKRDVSHLNFVFNPRFFVVDTTLHPRLQELDRRLIQRSQKRTISTFVQC